MQEFVNWIRRRLESTGGAIRAVTKDVSAEEAVWKPDPASWSIVEVVNHLADEEVEDFRTRVDTVLNRPGDPVPPIDPQAWIVSRAYASRPLGESVERFLTERERSIRWLGEIRSGDLDRAVTGARPGTTFTGRQLLAAWAAHDLLHLRQLTRLRYQYLARQISPVSLDYAGRW